MLRSKMERAQLGKKTGAAIKATRLGVLRSMTGLYTVAGFAALDFAAYRWHYLVGWCATGVSCLIMGFLVEKPDAK